MKEQVIIDVGLCISTKENKKNKKKTKLSHLKQPSSVFESKP